MERIFFVVILLVCGFTLSLNATTTTTTYYYGTKASTSGTNPCKGATTRMCAKVVVVTESIGSDVKVNQDVILLPEGNIISSTETIILNKTVEEVVNDITTEHKNNGGHVEIEED